MSRASSSSIFAFDLGKAFRCVVAILLMSTGLLSNSKAESAANAQSAVGINLQPVTYYSSEMAFLNIFKTGGSWLAQTYNQWSTGEEPYLNLDSDGWPITLTTVHGPSPQKFTALGVLLLNSLPLTANGYYPAGQYVVLYSGQGTLGYGFDAALVSSTPGRDVINIANPSSQGIRIQIIATDPNHTGNYLKNIQVVKAANESLITAGQVFDPMFVANLKNFRALRYMDWFNTNNSTAASWSSRPLPSNAFWGSGKGVPLEVAIQLANTLSADAWLNVPVMADNDYITQMASLVKNQLGSNQKAYVELSNEVWNSLFTQNAYSISQGQTLFPQALNKWYGGWEWYGMRVAQMSDIWYSSFGSAAFSSRVVVVMAGLLPDTAVMQEELTTPDWTGANNGPAVNHHIGAAAITGYFLSTPSATDLTTMLNSADGGLNELFASTSASGNTLSQSAASLANHVALVAPYKIPVVAYEGGQALQGAPNYGPGSPQLNLFIAANRDSRMGAVYTTFLNSWKTNGGTLFMHYNDSFPASQFGLWGLLESGMQTTIPLSSAPPKWQAVQNFISSQNCWWNACSATIGSSAVIVAPSLTPQAPSNLTVQ